MIRKLITAPLTALANNMSVWGCPIPTQSVKLSKQNPDCGYFAMTHVAQNFGLTCEELAL